MAIGTLNGLASSISTSTGKSIPDFVKYLREKQTGLDKASLDYIDVYRKAFKNTFDFSFNSVEYIIDGESLNWDNYDALEQILLLKSDPDNFAANYKLITPLPDVISSYILSNDLDRKIKLLVYEFQKCTVNTESLAIILKQSIDLHKETIKINETTQNTNHVVNESSKKLDEVLRKIDSVPIRIDYSSVDKTVFFALLLGGWSKKSSGDVEIINKYYSEGFDKFLNVIHEMKKKKPEILIFDSGKWYIKDRISILQNYFSFFFDKHLAQIQSLALDVLKEVNPKFELNQDERYAASIYGKISKYSDDMKKGIIETLAFVGSNANSFQNCTVGNANSKVILTVRGILENADWKTWANLSHYLPDLAESAPEEFISCVKKSLHSTLNPFKELSNQERAGSIQSEDYLPGLYWALETLAWNPDLMAEVVLILAELIKHNISGKTYNSARNSLITILLPWRPQTLATIPQRISTIKGIQRDFPEIVWTVLLGLLPNDHRFTMGSRKPKFRKFIPADWNDIVYRDEYNQQITTYSEMAFEIAKHKLEYMIEFVEYLDKIPESVLNKYLDHLISETISQYTEDKKYSLWEPLCKLIKKHLQFSTAKWALPVETTELISSRIEVIEPKEPEYFYRQYFSYTKSDFKKDDETWEQREERIDNLRVEGIEKVYSKGGLKLIIELAESVKNPVIVGTSFASIASEEDDLALLPNYLNSELSAMENFIGGYVAKRYSIKGGFWLDCLIDNNWSEKEKLKLLLNLPFNKDTWLKCSELINNEESYWRNLPPHLFSIDKDLDFAIEKLIEFGRPILALDFIDSYNRQNNIFLSDFAIKALKNIETPYESMKNTNPHTIIEVIKAIQNDEKLDDEIKLEIEWGYLKLLDGYHGATTTTIQRYLSEKPDYFIDMIKVMYGADEASLNEDDQTRAGELFMDIYSVISDWHRPPGSNEEGDIDEEHLLKWFSDFEEHDLSPELYENAMYWLGHVLFFAIKDKKAVENWIPEPVAEILNKRDCDDVRNGFSNKVYNARGVHTVHPEGKPERELAEFWRKRADNIESEGFINFASGLRNIAASYDKEAEKTIADYKFRRK